MTTAVLIPVLGRPHRARPVYEAFTTTADCDVVFIADPDDRDEITAVRETGASLLVDTGGYARKINTAVRQVKADRYFLAADDLDPQPGWLDHALSLTADVIGVNDLIPRPHRPDHATHFLLTRSYAHLPTIDGERGPLCEQYRHSFVDDELIATATKRGVYAYAENAHVRHDHPMVGAADDDTYRKGRKNFQADRRLYYRRKRLWR